MRLRHRQRGQITAFALYAMLVLIGALALVVDAGVFFVTQRQLQTAVDAAVLAAVWYSPVCSASLVPASTDCQNVPPSPAPALPATIWICDPVAQFDDCVANAVLQENVGYSGRLCRILAPVPTGRRDVISTPDGPLTTYLMTVDCDAPYWFARIFPTIPAVLHLRVWARATIGYPTTTGVSPKQALPGDRIVSRLLP